MSTPATSQNRDLVLSAAHTPTTLAAWHCDLDDPIEFRMQVLDWLYRTGAPSLDEHRRGIHSVRLERHGDTTTVVVTRRTPPGVPAVRERWPMTVEPPARPADPTLNPPAGQPPTCILNELGAAPDEGCPR